MPIKYLKRRPPKFFIIKILFSALNKLSGLLTRPERLIKMKFLVLEKKYLECLEQGDSLKALMVNKDFFSKAIRYLPFLTLDYAK